jgi:DNA-binding winged helix-turn-helix (wHTH) protein/TolB-like protein/Flp pilus assembly protein TadD
MLASKLARELYEFGRFRLDPAAGQLSSGGKAIPLEPKAFQTLLFLVRNRGRLVEKDELMREVWPDRFVEENNLTRNISILRKTLGKDQNGNQYIETAARRGYRFVGSVTQLEERDNDVADFVAVRQAQYRAALQEAEAREGESRLEACGPRDRPNEAARSLTETSPAVKQASRPVVLVAAVLLSIGVVASVFYVARGRSVRAPALGVKSIAILPFKTTAGKGLNDYIGLGLSDALTTKLGNLREIVVRPASAVQKVAGGQKEAVEAGRELGVEAVLAGRVETIGARVRVTTQLIDVRDERILWTGTLDEDSSTVWRLEDTIADQLAGVLTVSSSTEERRGLIKRQTENPKAYEAYLKGRNLWNKRTAADFANAVEYFQQALAIDPNYALAYAGLADCYSFQSEIGKARSAASSALELDDSLAEAHASLGNILLFADRKLAEAGRELARACELNPNYANAHHWYAYYLSMTGRKEEAVAEMRRAVEIDPQSPILNTDLGQMLCFSHDYAEAIAQLRKTVQIDPGFVMAHRRLGDVYFLSGMGNEGLSEYRRCEEIGAVGFGALGAARAYARSGMKREAIKELRRFTAVPERYLPGGGYLLVAICVEAGETDEAFTWLTGVCRLSNDVCLIGADPVFDPIRSDPRYKELMEKLGLPA